MFIHTVEYAIKGHKRKMYTFPSKEKAKSFFELLFLEHFTPEPEYPGDYYTDTSKIFDYNGNNCEAAFENYGEAIDWNNWVLLKYRCVKVGDSPNEEFSLVLGEPFKVDLYLVAEWNSYGMRNVFTFSDSANAEKCFITLFKAAARMGKRKVDDNNNDADDARLLGMAVFSSGEFDRHRIVIIHKDVSINSDILAFSHKDDKVIEKKDMLLSISVIDKLGRYV